MIRRGIILHFMFLSICGYGQDMGLIRTKLKESTLGSLQTETGETARIPDLSKLDSLQNQSRIHRFKDSLKIVSWSDSLRQRVEQKFSPNDMLHKGDSLRAINLPAERVTGYSDSLRRKKESMMAEIVEKQKNLHETVTFRYDAWMKGALDRFKLDSVGVKVPELDQGNANSLPKANLPSTSLPTAHTGSMGLGSTQIPEVPLLNTTDFSSLGLSEELTKIGGRIAIPSSDQLGNWDNKLTSMPDLMSPINERMADVKSLKADPGALAEKAVGQMEEVTTATSAMKEAERLKEQHEALKLAEQVKNPESIKEAAINHFQGQEAALGSAMSQIAKYKQKYSSIGSLSEIKKENWLPKNGLKGKPFRERFRLGLHSGFKTQSDTLLLDFYPNASYRITGRLEAGIGAIYRVRINTKDFTFDQRDPVWGFSTFAVVKTFKSVFLRFEVDGNSFPKSGVSDQSINRDWRWTFHSGFQTNFKLGKLWTGNIQMLYNFDKSLKDGFPEKLALRAGVQYQLSKRSKAASK